MKFFAKRRFNYIDALGLAMISHVSKQNWFITVPIIFVLFVLSVYVENKE